jgi:hypothetical protein
VIHCQVHPIRVAPVYQAFFCPSGQAISRIVPLLARSLLKQVEHRTLTAWFHGNLYAGNSRLVDY